MSPADPQRGVSGQGFDLLRLRWVRAAIVSPLFPCAVQACALAVFVAFAVLAWGYRPPQGIEDKDYAKANLVVLVVWGLWWPAMVWIAVLFGRIWCAVCPMELVANLTERLGRAAGLRQLVLRRWIRSGVVILALYALVQMLVVVVHLHRIPAYTSLFLWGLLALAAVSGLLLKDRAFCRGFCPVGLLLGTYGRGSMLAVRPAAAEPCGACNDHDCTRANRRDRLDARSCPSLLNPAKLNGNSDCLVCGQCIKSCQPGNMGLFLRWPFHAADVREALASWPVTLFVMLVFGFVSFELCSEWKAAQTVYLWVPEQLAGLSGMAGLGRWFQGIWMLVLVPVALWTLLGAIVRLLGGARTMAEAWRRLALPLVVVVAAGQMAKAVAKTASWAGYVPLALREPTGTKTVLGIAAGTTPKPAALLPMTAVSAVSLLVLLAMTYFALRESRLADPSTHRARVVPIAVVAAASAFIVFGWGVLS